MKPHELPRRSLRLHHALIALSFIAPLTARSAAQDKNAPTRTPPPPAASTIAKGETVSDMAKDIWHVFQDRSGNYWFGSHTDGLYRYDGKTITKFTMKDGLFGNQIGGIQEDKSGNLYFTTLRETFTPPNPRPTYPSRIIRFDGKAFHTLPEPGNTYSAWKSEPGDLWFGGGAGDVIRWDGKTMHRLKMPRTKIGEDFMGRYDIYTTFKDSRGHIWFGTGNIGALRFDGKSLAWIAEDEFTWLKDGAMFGLRSIIEDKDGKFWFTNTLHRYDVARDVSASGELSYKKEKGIDNGTDDDDYFQAAVKDKNGDLWMSTYGAGVWRYDGKNMTRYPVMAGNTPITVFSIYKDKQDGLWLGTHENGVYKFNGKTFERFRP